MRKHRYEVLHEKRSVGERVADAFSLIVVGSVVAAIFYLGFLLRT